MANRNKKDINQLMILKNLDILDDFFDQSELPSSVADDFDDRASVAGTEMDKASMSAYTVNTGMTSRKNKTIKKYQVRVEIRSTNQDILDLMRSEVSTYFEL